MTLPLALVGVSFRQAPTHVRASLAALAEEDEPLQSLREAGHLSGAVCLATCSRTEWLMSGNHPEWSAHLLRSALSSRIPELAPQHLYLRIGHAAIHHSMRVTVGLDSVAEGESAIGRQVLKAFEKSRQRGFSSVPLNRLGRALERLIHQRRKTVPPHTSRGVQSLVREALLEVKPKNVAILGRGEFGLALERCLRSEDAWKLQSYARSGLSDLWKSVATLDALVVCTGGDKPWLDLPDRSSPGVCIDAGSPPQVRSSPGWTLWGLDALLGREELLLEEKTRETLETLVAEGARDLAVELASPERASTLAALHQESKSFLNEQLPQLLTGLSTQEARRVKQAVGAFAHRLLVHTRKGDR